MIGDDLMVYDLYEREYMIMTTGVKRVVVPTDKAWLSASPSFAMGS